MPLPHFLLMLIAVVFAAAVTLWVTVAADIPMVLLALVALSAAVLVHYSQKDHPGHDG